MALRLRRGTDLERQQIAPAEGELIYTTDTKKLYIGDGDGTVGGIPVDSDTIVSELSDLADVDTTSVAVGDVLKWNGAAFVPGADNQNDAIIDGNTYFINIDGDVTGSVFGDDSTVLVDGVSGTIVGEIDTDLGTVQTLNTQSINVARGISDPLIKIISETNTGSFGVPVISINNNHTGTYGQEITFNRSNGTHETPTAAQSGDYSGSITVRAHDGNDYTTIGAMHVVADAVNGTDDVESSILFLTRNGAIATDYSTMLKLGKGAEVSGYVQFGSYTTTERNALTPAFGMVIYNTTTNVFEGYQNTGGSTPEWVALS